MRANAHEEVDPLERSDRTALTPLLKWPGGKRWLFPEFEHLFRKPYKRYIEPFVGGGAVFFYLRPLDALIADINPELVSLYRAVREDWRQVQSLLAEHHTLHSIEHYYKVREDVRGNRFERAARTLYLNRTCWNGLYRVNRRGNFNVPIGTKSRVLLPSDDFQSTASALRRADVQRLDFEQTIQQAGKGDLIFADPPYVRSSADHTFRKYHSALFGWKDQERLRAALDTAAGRGARIVMVNAHHQSLVKLYKGFGRTIVACVRNTISASSEHRGTRTEMVVIRG